MSLVVEMRDGAQIEGGSPLGKHEFAATLGFEFHRLVQRDDRALNLIVGGIFGRDPLQPQSRRGHQRE